MTGHFFLTFRLYKKITLSLVSDVSVNETNDGVSVSVNFCVNLKKLITKEKITSSIIQIYKYVLWKNYLDIYIYILLLLLLCSYFHNIYIYSFIVVLIKLQ